VDPLADPSHTYDDVADARRTPPGASAVEKYVTDIFAKLALPPSSADHGRVLAVLRYLGA
jgi:hypothetical protein